MTTNVSELEAALAVAFLLHSYLEDARCELSRSGGRRGVRRAYGLPDHLAKHAGSFSFARDRPFTGFLPHSSIGSR